MEHNGNSLIVWSLKFSKVHVELLPMSTKFLRHQISLLTNIVDRTLHNEKAALANFRKCHILRHAVSLLFHCYGTCCKLV